MKKRIIFLVLFVLCWIVCIGSISNYEYASEDIEVRNIYIADEKRDISYYEKKYDLYNEENTHIEIKECYNSNQEVLDKNLATNDLEVYFEIFIHKEEAYFILSYEAYFNEELVSTNSVRISLVEYEDKYYFVSNNGITPYEEAIKISSIENCTVRFVSLYECVGVADLGGMKDICGGGVGAAAAMMVVAAGSSIKSFGRNSAISNYFSDKANTKPQEDTGNSNSNEEKDIPEVNVEDLPENVQEAYKKYNDAGWQGKVSGQSETTKAGGTWENRNDQLPNTDEEGKPITYKEFDVNNKDGLTRDEERFVVGSDGSVYYTDSHYGDGESKNGFPPFVKLK